MSDEAIWIEGGCGKGGHLRSRVLICVVCLCVFCRTAPLPTSIQMASARRQRDVLTRLPKRNGATTVSEQEKAVRDQDVLGTGPFGNTMVRVRASRVYTL